uniref:Anti-proliferative protein domain-containing protein n=1 Tax=Leptobrachium leishanense TaxID=445787 RepID=A0A8C5Q7S0_9ANUR
MHEEIKLGASYIVRLLNRHQKLDDDQVTTFIETLASILSDRFKGHWYPDCPQKGQAYRCIRIQQNDLDDSVLQACFRSGLRCSQLALPRDMYLWIDPEEVMCRLGEHCRPFKVKLPEIKVTQKSSSVDKSDQETSDYHSDGSEASATPSESSSEDEESGGTKAANNLKATQKLGAQYYYNPSPASAVYYSYPRNAVSFIPAYQPVTLYYMIPKPVKFYQGGKSKGNNKNWRPNRTSPMKAAEN